MENLKLNKLKVQDFQNLKFVECNFDGKNLVEISGKNGSGKSSLIDSLIVAILGPKYFRGDGKAWSRIRQGEDEALFKVIIGSREREIEIKRRITKSGTSLIAKDTKGGKMAQAELDSLLNEFTVDPLEFARKTPKDQIEIIRELMGVDTSELERQESEIAERRLEFDREVRRLKALTANPPEYVEEIDVNDLLAKQADIHTKNAEIVDRNRHGEQLEGEWESRTEIVEKLSNTIEDMQSKLQSLIRRQEEEQKELADLKKELDAFEPEVLLETEAVDKALRESSETNNKAREYQDYLKNEEALKAAKSNKDDCELDIKSVRAQKQELVKNSKLPFDSLEFDDELGLVVDGIPFNQRSTGEKLKYSTRIGMEMKEGLRLMCIRNGAELDPDNLRMIAEIAQKHDYQILLETVEPKKGENCLVMHQGTVVSQFETEEKSGDIL